MFTIEELKRAAGEEIRIVRHLATKVDPAKLDWRPSENQRSTIELLRYLAICAAAPAKAVVEDDWGAPKEFAERVAQLDLAGFDRAMVDQERELHAILDALTDADLVGREAKLPWGVTVPLAEALYQTTVRFLVAYRMQLFLYAKQSGASELGTYDAWMGVDAPQPAGP